MKPKPDMTEQEKELYNRHLSIVKKKVFNDVDLTNLHLKISQNYADEKTTRLQASLLDLARKSKEYSDTLQSRLDVATKALEEAEEKLKIATQSCWTESDTCKCIASQVNLINGKYICSTCNKNTTPY